MSVRHLARVMILAVVCTPGLAAQTPFPERPPAAEAIRPNALPTVQEQLLPNGLRLIVLEDHAQPVLSLALSLPAGSAFDPPGLEGAADLMAQLMTTAIGERTQLEVARAVERIGGSLSAAADPDFLTLRMDALADQAAAAFQLLADAALRPAFREDDVARLRQSAAAALEAGLSDPGSMAARVFLVGAYRRHPYGNRATPQSLRAISRADLAALRAARAHPAGSTILVAGDISLAEARRLTTQSFGAWKGVRPTAVPARDTSGVPGGIVLVHAGGVPDASIIIGGPTFAGADTGYYAATVLNSILGDARSGRLARALNQDHRWNAAAGSAYLRTLRLGVIQATASVQADVADSVVDAMQAELERLRTDLVPARELERSREMLAGAFALGLQTTSQVAGAVLEARLLGLPASYVSGYRGRITSVTAAQVRAAARRVFPPGRVVTVVVGDASRLYRPLSRLGPVRIFSATGEPLTAEQVEPRAVELSFDASSWTPRTDSLAIVAQGQTIGLQVVRLERSGGTLRYTEETALRTALRQDTRLELDTLGHMREVLQTGRVQGKDTRITLHYGNGRVTGEAVLPAPNGTRTVPVDAAVTPRALDDNAVQAILPLLQWTLNTRWTFDVFAATENVLRRMTLTVADVSRVTTPAGTFDCYRADLIGGPQRVSFFVQRDAPHRLVKVELAGSPIEFLLVNR